MIKEQDTELHLLQLILVESIKTKSMALCIAMLFNNGQTAYCLCLLHTSYGEGSKGVGGPQSNLSCQST